MLISQTNHSTLRKCPLEKYSCVKWQPRTITIKWSFCVVGCTATENRILHLHREMNDRIFPMKKKNKILIVKLYIAFIHSFICCAVRKYSLFRYFVDSVFKALHSLFFHLHRNLWPIWSSSNHHVQSKFRHVFNSSGSISAEKFLLVFPEMLRINEKKVVAIDFITQPWVKFILFFVFS